jgi:Rod binding domain-containing protein
MTVEAIKDAIAGLPAEERHSLAAWLNDLDYDAWDKQMVEDFSPGGRGIALAERLKQQIAERQARPLDEGFAKRDPSRT